MHNIAINRLEWVLGHLGTGAMKMPTNLQKKRVKSNSEPNVNLEVPKRKKNEVSKKIGRKKQETISTLMRIN